MNRQSLSNDYRFESWEHEARRWTPRLLRYAARVLGGSGDAPETARDVVQETWIGAIRGLRWGAASALGFGGVALVKVWFWMDLQKNAIMREVKRLELQVASLAAQLKRP